MADTVVESRVGGGEGLGEKRMREEDDGEDGERKDDERKEPRVEKEDENGAVAGGRRNLWAEGRTGGVYIPPHRLKKLQESIVEDKSSPQYQRMQWELLKKRINGVVNKVNVSNLTEIAIHCFREDLIRGRGLFCRAILKAQLSSPEFTNVYTAMVAIVNSKMPEIGELLLARVIMQFRRAYKRNDKIMCISATKFIAHLVNQQVAHEILALQLITLLLEKPTNDSVEVSISFVKECGALLGEVSPQGLHAVFERLRSILHEGEIDKRVQYMIEALFTVRRNNFADYPIVLEDLDVVEEEDKITHELSLDDTLETETGLDIFKYDPDYEENEAKYLEIRKEILGDDEDGDEEEGDSDEDDEDGGDDGDKSRREGDAKVHIDDQTGQMDVDFRRKVYLTIMSALSYEECAHKLMKVMNGTVGKEPALCQMLLECCGQERSYLKFYGLLGSRFCSLNQSYAEALEGLFAEYYGEVHRFETSRIRNIAKFFSAVLSSMSMPWTLLELISVTEEETTSSSRIFLKVLFQDLAREMGLESLKKHLSLEELQPYVRGLFPKDNPQNTRFAINFFTSVGLGAITDELREHLKTMPKFVIPESIQNGAEKSDDDLSSSDSSSSSSSSGSGSSSDSSSSSNSRSDSSSSSASVASTDDSGAREERTKKRKEKTADAEEDSGKKGRAESREKPVSKESSRRKEETQSKDEPEAASSRRRGRDRSPVQADRGRAESRRRSSGRPSPPAEDDSRDLSANGRPPPPREQPPRRDEARGRGLNRRGRGGPAGAGRGRGREMAKPAWLAREEEEKARMSIRRSRNRRSPSSDSDIELKRDSRRRHSRSPSPRRGGRRTGRGGRDQFRSISPDRESSRSDSPRRGRRRSPISAGRRSSRSPPRGRYSRSSSRGRRSPPRRGGRRASPTRRADRRRSSSRSLSSSSSTAR